MATQHRGGHESGQQGSVKDPEHDGRLKENREAGRTKGTTPASEARSHESGGKSSSGGHASHQSGGHASGSHSSGSHSSGSHSSGTQSSPHESESRRGSSHEGGHGGSSASAHGGQSDSDDLKSREYRDEKGEVHHHTRTYMEQHGSDKNQKK
jgi:hypothetical protein